jgi:hypothetical protein
MSMAGEIHLRFAGEESVRIAVPDDRDVDDVVEDIIQRRGDFKPGWIVDENNPSRRWNLDAVVKMDIERPDAGTPS